MGRGHDFVQDVPRARDRQVTAAVDEPRIDIADVQGNVVPSFNKPCQQFLFFSIRDRGEARTWFRNIAREITTCHDVLQRRAARRAALDASRTTEPDVWLNAGLSHRGCVALSEGRARVGNEAFKRGFRSRLSSFGWTPGSSNWRFGDAGHSVDAVVILACDEDGRLERSADRLIASATAGLTLVFRQHAAALTGALAAKEHFGFIDGIANPGLRGLTDLPERPWLTNPADAAREHVSRLWPGEFLLGYPAEADAVPGMRGEIATAGPDYLKGSSFLAIARFTQDSNGWLRWRDEAAANLCRLGADGLDGPKLGARMMGRWPSGAPVSLSPDHDDEPLGADKTRRNAFRGTDTNAVACPVDSHVRRAYPWGANAPPYHRRRLLRRGIPFGAAGGSAEKGLVFVSYQSSLERQFEFTMSTLAHDPLIGQGARTFEFSYGKAGPSRRYAVPIQDSWAVLTGGEYFLAPSLSALEGLTA